MEDVSQQQAPSFQPAQQQSSNISSNNISSKSKLKFIIAIIVITILFAGIGGYFMWQRDSQLVSQNSLSKFPQDCGIDFDCFIKASKSCNPAIVKKLWTSSSDSSAIAIDIYKVNFEIKGQETAKCVLHVTTEDLAVKWKDSEMQKLSLSGKTQAEIKQTQEAYLKKLSSEDDTIRSASTCRFDGNDLTLALQEIGNISDLDQRRNPRYVDHRELHFILYKEWYDVLNKDKGKWDCDLKRAQESSENLSPVIHISPKVIAEENDTTRRSDVVAILNAVDQYRAGNEGVLPSGITMTNQEISNTTADICSSIVTLYLAALPVDPQINKGTPIADCTSSYSTGYNIIKDRSTNKITVSAPNAELDDEITITR